MAHRARYFWLLASAAACSACAGSVARAPVHESATVSSPKPPSELGVSPDKANADDAGPRLFPPLEGPSTISAGEERDGSQRLVSYGLRLLSRPSGSVELAREYLPVARAVQSLELPARLGGGFLFYVQSSNATLFFRAPTFTGDLEPFARLDFEADQVIAGFDRLYVLSHRPDRFVALDAEHGSSLGLGSLPPSPGYEKMAFADAWLGAVEVPFRGTLLTFDAGASWRPLGFASNNVELQNGALRLTGPDGVLDLDSSGTFTRRDAPSPAAAAAARENAVAQALRGKPEGSAVSHSARDRLGQNALKLAVLRGFRDADGSFVVANAGTLLRVRASDGKLLASDEHAFPGGGECNAVPFGRGFAFSCNDSTSGTTLYSFLAPFGMQRVRSFAGARYVASSGNGALVIRGSCSGPSNAAGAYCIAANSADFREIRVRGDLGVERVIALSDGRVAVVVPPRLGGSGFLSLIDARGREQRFALKLPSAAPAQLLEKGLWLDGFVERANGLAGWVVGAEPFAGVRVALDGTVTMGHPENSIDRALLSAAHALLVGRTGRARESIDGGFEWSDVELPSEYDAGRELKDEARLQGCSDLGCAFGGFVRVGWGGKSGSPHLSVARLPDSTPMLQPGGNRWLLHCEATGEQSLPAEPQAPRPRGPGRSDDGANPPWAPFLELPPPALGTGEVGFDVASNDGDVAPFHAYSWGERGADWGRAGYLQLRAFDRFSVLHGVVQSAPTRSPWPDAAAAAEAFGFDGSNNPVSWRAVLDAEQHAAAVLVSSRGLLDLLLFEEGKTVARIANAGRLGFGMLSSVAKLSDAWYVGSFNESHSLTLSRIVGNRAERLAEYPDPGRDIGSANLVHGVHGEGLALWVAGPSWYLFPIDPTSYAIQAPLYESAADLAQIPAACAADADGFLVSGAPSLEPSLRFPRGGEELGARRVEAQFIWSARGLCTRALAADTEARVARIPASLSQAPMSAKLATLPLTVAERRPQGRRLGYVCSP